MPIIEYGTEYSHFFFKFFFTKGIITVCVRLCACLSLSKGFTRQSKSKSIVHTHSTSQNTDQMAAVAAASASSSQSQPGTRTSGKPDLAFLVARHVDAGGATLVGRLMVLLGAVDRRSVEKIKKESEAMGKLSFMYAWLSGQLAKEERERGITVRLHHRVLETERSVFHINLPPAHRDFIGGFFRGTAESRALLLVVAAARGEFECGICSDGGTREFAMIACSMGIKHVVVAINKMDAVAANCQERYNEVVQEMAAFLKKTGFSEAQTTFVPVSAWTGDNLVQPSQHMPWYTGKTLVEAMDECAVAVEEARLKSGIESKPLRFLVEDVRKIIGIPGAIVTGVVASGTLSVGDRLVIAPVLNPWQEPMRCRDPALPPPSKKYHFATVHSIEQDHKSLPRASAGQIIGINFRDIPVAGAVRNGSVLGHEQNVYTPMKAIRFVANVVNVGHGGGIKAGYTPIMQLGTAQVPVRWVRLISKNDRRTGKVIEDNPKLLNKNEAGVVEMEPMNRGLCCEVFSSTNSGELSIPALNRFAMRDLRMIVAVGCVVRVDKEGYKWMGRKIALLIRMKSRNRFGEAFSVWNICTTTGLFIA